jgi:antitoxin component of MazEF toxin-antitoxin module
MKKINVRGPGKLKEVFVRKVRNFGGSFSVTLPKSFCDQNNIKVGDSMAVIIGGELRITPVNKGE